jgi:quercetin dioxygenase-like cupin family protein
MQKILMPLTAAVVALVAVAVQAASAETVDSLLSWDDLRALKIYHAYSASDGRTYVEVISVPSSEKQSGGAAAQMYFDLKPQQLRIGRSKSGVISEWHYAGEMRHLIITLQGDIVFDVGDGTLLHVRPGEAILAEDWTGKGHRSGCLSPTKATCAGIDILLEPNPRALPLRAPPKQR